MITSSQTKQAIHDVLDNIMEKSEEVRTDQNVDNITIRVDHNHGEVKARVTLKMIISSIVKF